MNSLFISYDLYRPDHDYPDLFKVIRSLGSSVHVKLTLWQVRSALDAFTARDRIKTILQRQDKLIVINTSNNTGAWCGLSDEVAKALLANWS
jgi:hypothetical protein